MGAFFFFLSDVSLSFSKFPSWYNISMKNINYLNKIFTIPYLDSIQHSKHFQSVLSDKNISLPTTYKSVITDLYQKLQDTHRNEYFYKNELLNSLLIQNRKISSCSALTELPVAKSKTDMIFVDENDVGIVYEIKTELQYRYKYFGKTRSS